MNQSSLVKWSILWMSRENTEKSGMLCTRKQGSVLKIIDEKIQNTLHTIMVNICHYTFIQTTTEYTTPRVSPCVNYRLQVAMVCQCGFIHCTIGITMVGNVDNGVGI